MKKNSSNTSDDDNDDDESDGAAGAVPIIVAPTTTTTRTMDGGGGGLAAMMIRAPALPASAPEATHEATSLARWMQSANALRIGLQDVEVYSTLRALVPGCRVFHLPKLARIVTHVNAAFRMLHTWVVKHAPTASADILVACQVFAATGPIAEDFATRLARCLMAARFNMQSFRELMVKKTDGSGGAEQEVVIRSGVLTNSLSGLQALASWLVTNVQASLATRLLQESAELGFARSLQQSLTYTRKQGTIQQKLQKRQRTVAMTLQTPNSEAVDVQVRSIARFVLALRTTVAEQLPKFSTTAGIFGNLVLLFSGAGTFPLRSGFAAASSIGTGPPDNIVVSADRSQGLGF